ncbi:hypothetical protein LNP20_10470 [Klebsiella pneumoniae subsp. pneumoniae]|nr:hypothetical protein [Klebsiella pneumoniae subsp. pneumoniae]
MRKTEGELPVFCRAGIQTASADEAGNAFALAIYYEVLCDPLQSQVIQPLTLVIVLLQSA